MGPIFYMRTDVRHNQVVLASLEAETRCVSKLFTTIPGAIGMRVGLRASGWGFDPQCGQKVESEKSEFNNSGHKLIGLTW